MKQVPFFLTLLLFSFGSQTFAQEKNYPEKLLGYWEGAFIKGNAYQKLELQFYERAGKLFSLQVMEEWHPAFGEFELPVEVDSTGKISMNTGYGKANLRLDGNFLELLGQLEAKNPATYIHLKKAPAPPAPDFEVKEVTVKHGDIQLSGHFHIPKNSNGTAIILVGGRGCYAGNTKYDLYAKFLRKYGISVLVYNKRGTGKSTGDCSKATINDLASDVLAWKTFIEAHANTYEKIGALGSSAGGWIIANASEKTEFDFLISIVGPATSLKDQQLQSGEAGASFYKLSPKALEQVLVYTGLMFSAPPTESSFAKFQDYLKKAEEEDWKKILDDTDIPASAQGIEQLWVRRHAYDPGTALKSFNKPFLAIYGQRDWIVPVDKNIPLLQSYFSGERAALLTTVTTYNGEHGNETEEKYVKLEDGTEYWHFFRISPQLHIEIQKFLKKHGFID